MRVIMAMPVAGAMLVRMPVTLVRVRMRVGVHRLYSTSIVVAAQRLRALLLDG
jgi:hypothetical protein